MQAMLVSVLCGFGCSGGPDPEDRSTSTDESHPTGEGSGPDDTDSAGSDTGPGDTGSAVVDCADPAGFVGAGGGTLEATEAAVYCVLNVTTVAGLANKRRIAFTSGSYPLPLEDGTHSYRLPVCAEGPTGPAQSAAVGELSRTTAATGGGVQIDLSYTQPVTLGDEAAEVVWTFYGSGSAPPAPILDEHIYRDEAGGSAQSSLSWCSDAVGCQVLMPCATPRAGLDPEVLRFDRGELSLYIDVVYSVGVWIDLPRVLYRAEGVFDGVAFSQADDYRLGYAYTAHGLDRDLIVMFDTPLSGACGVVGRYGRPGQEYLALIDCDGVVLEELSGVQLGGSGGR